MAYYDALIAAWNGATTIPAGVMGTAFVAGDTTAQKLAKINAWTVLGPKQDVRVGDVIHYLGVAGLLTAMEDWLAGLASPTPSNVITARIAAKELLRVIASSHVDSFKMSDPATYSQMQGMLNALAASPPGFLSAQNVSDLLAMAATAVAWWQSAGYTSPFSNADLAAAGGLT